jgi:hypothetical protein
LRQRCGEVRSDQYQFQYQVSGLAGLSGIHVRLERTRQRWLSKLLMTPIRGLETRPTSHAGAIELTGDRLRAGLKEEGAPSAAVEISVSSRPSRARTGQPPPDH